MSTRVVKLPGADHPITIEPAVEHIVITVSGHRIAETRQALRLCEAHYPAVYYVPREDVDLLLIERSAHTTYCPYKGDCSYYSIPVGGQRSVNAIWTYETPHAAVARIGGYMAFYPERVDRFERR